MAIYSLAVRTTNTTINQAAVELYTAATVAVKVYEIGISQVTGTSVAWGLGRPANQGVTPVAAVFQAEQSTADPAAKTNLSLSWGTSPTAPAVYLRKAYTLNQIGAGIIWTFPRGLYVPVSASLVVFNITASVASDIWFVIDE
jgi:hypothetical protein